MSACKKLLLEVALIIIATGFATAQNDSSQFESSRFVFTTISGPVRNALVYAPKPKIPPVAVQQHLSGRGIYKMDLDNGAPYDARVVRSTGYKVLDDAALEALRTWRFLPHRLTWVEIPIEFRATSSSAKH